MGSYTEFTVPEALCPELEQALVMLYCRYLNHEGDRQTLRRLARFASALTIQFDAFDRLHAEFPFATLGARPLGEELSRLVEHNRQIHSLVLCQQLRRLCQAEPALAPWARGWPSDA